MLLIMALTLGCTSAMAELKVPRTTAEIPNIQEPVKIPEFEVVVEDGYAVLVTDWFDDAEDITDGWGNSVFYATDLEYPYYHTTDMVYDAERGAFVSKEPAEYTEVDTIQFSKYDKNGNWFSVGAFLPETGEDFLNTWRSRDVWDRLSSYGSGYPQLMCQSSRYTYYWYWNESVEMWEDRTNMLKVFFDEDGNAVSYKYSVWYAAGKYTTVQYDMNGTLEAATIPFAEGSVQYNAMDAISKDWYYSSAFHYDPPTGLSVESISAKYPPLVGGKPVAPASGDINGSGEVELTDVLGVSKYLAGEGRTIDLNAANVNGDYDVNTQDVLHLMQYFAGWDVELK